MRSADLIDAIQARPSLHGLLLRYMQFAAIQLAHTALANGRYAIEARLARWLLMCHDRMEGDELYITHEFLSLMLGVRRAGVSVALSELEAKNAILRLEATSLCGIVPHFWNWLAAATALPKLSTSVSSG
jgi:CRP-like cAMP-binding protein